MLASDPGKDKKYGFGGKTRFSKSNDAKSTSDFSSFKLRSNNAPFKKV